MTDSGYPTTKTFLQRQYHRLMAVPAFRYDRPLKTGEIRLVKLLRRTSPEDSLRFTLQYHLLRSKLPYWALSYAWGDPNDTITVSCDGHPFPITKSLYAALEQLMDLDLLTPIWIDAASINQKDLDEKAHQVRMMQDIYRNSSRTIIWLGESQSSDDRAIQLMQTLNAKSPKTNTEDISKTRLSGSSSLPASGTSSVKDLYHSDQLPPLDDDAWRALGKFYERSWFSRIWIIQELCTGDHCVMLCGRRFISCDIVLATASRWMKDDIMPMALLAPTGVRTASALADINFQYQRDRSLTLLSLLTLSTGFQFTINHDRIFALLGLTKGIDQAIIDYRTPIWELLVQVVLLLHDQLLEQHRSPFVIFRHCSQRQSRLRGIPSWLPDWRSPDGFTNSITADLFPTAYVDSHPKFHFEAHQYLNVQGKIFDAVETVFEGIYLMKEQDQWLRHDLLKTAIGDELDTYGCVFVRAIEDLRSNHQSSSMVDNAHYQDRLFRALCVGYMQVNPQDHVLGSPPGRFDARDLWDNFRDFVLNREIVNQHKRDQQWRMMRYLHTNHPIFYHYLAELTYEKRHFWLSTFRSVAISFSLLGYWKGATQIATYLILSVQLIEIVKLCMKYIQGRWPGRPNSEVEYATAVMKQTRHDYELFKRAYGPWWDRNSFFTSQGGRFGWALRPIKRGDRICVFEGNRAPFILRPLAERAEHPPGQTCPTVYEQCGEAYVSDVMDHEIHNSTQLGWSTIRLG